MNKYDIVMWAKDGGRFLPFTLSRIDEEIPAEFIRKKIFVDDSSKDNSASIARSFNWEVFSNPSHGIGAGASLALSKVETDHFISFEQDILLCHGWWNRISSFAEVNRQDTAVAQGWRVATDKTIGDMDRVGISQFRDKLYSIDNNIFLTKAVREAGGFTSEAVYHVDAVLRYRLACMGWKWLCDFTTISEHMKPGGWKAEAKRHYLMSLEHPKLLRMGILGGDDARKLSKRSLLFGFIRSPAVGAALAMKYRNPALLPYYVGLRHARMMGNFRGANA